MRKYKVNKSKQQNYNNFIGVCNHRGFGRLFQIWDIYFKYALILQSHSLL